MKKLWLFAFIVLITSCRQKLETELCNADIYNYLSSSLGIDGISTDIESIDLYIVHEQILLNTSYSSAADYELAQEKSKIYIDDEEKFREICNYSIHLQGTPMYYVEVILSNAERTVPEPAESKDVRGTQRNIRGIQGGMIIDMHLKEGMVRSFIMHNDGRNLFYEKGKEGEYYKMPKVLLEKFHISFSEASKSTKIFFLPFALPF